MSVIMCRTEWAYDEWPRQLKVSMKAPITDASVRGWFLTGKLIVEIN